MARSGNQNQASEVYVKHADGKPEIDTPFRRSAAFYLDGSYTPDGSPAKPDEGYVLVLTVEGAKSWLGAALKLAKDLDEDAAYGAIETECKRKLMARLEMRILIRDAALAIARWIDDENRAASDKAILDQIHLLRVIEKLIDCMEKIHLADRASLIFLDLAISFAIDLGAHSKVTELASVESKLESERARNREIAEQKRQKAQEENARIYAEGEKFCRDWRSRNRFPAKGREASHHPSKQEVMEGVAAVLNSQGCDLDTSPDGKLDRLLTLKKIKQWCGLKSAKK